MMEDVHSSPASGPAASSDADRLLARPSSALPGRAASEGPASRKRRSAAGGTLPAYARQPAFALTTGAAVFGDQWPTGAQMTAFAHLWSATSWSASTARTSSSPASTAT